MAVAIVPAVVSPDVPGRFPIKKEFVKKSMSEQAGSF
jgi:hypothetical protein